MGWGVGWGEGHARVPERGGVRKRERAWKQCAAAAAAAAMASKSSSLLQTDGFYFVRPMRWRTAGWSWAEMRDLGMAMKAELRMQLAALWAISWRHEVGCPAWPSIRTSIKQLVPRRAPSRTDPYAFRL